MKHLLHIRQQHRRQRRAGAGAACGRAHAIPLVEDARPAHPLIGLLACLGMLLGLVGLLLPSRLAGVEIPAPGGTLIPISAPGANYANDDQHPWPCMVYLPDGYSATGAPYPLVFCLHGDGEVGNGSSDGTLTASSTNQLAYVFNSGPLVLVKSGSTYFGDNHVIVVSPQSDIGNGAGFDGEASNVDRVDLTMQYLLATYHIDPARIYTMGLSCGAGALVRYAYASAISPTYQLAAIIPIANIQGLGTTYTNFSKFTGSITWFIGDCDDTTAYIRLNTGRTWSGYGAGWAGGISLYLDQALLGGPLPADSIKDRCLTTHPDIAAITAAGFNAGNGSISASTVTGTYTGSYSSSNPAGWTWVPDETFSAGSRLQITIRQGGGHAGWAQTFGTTTPNLPFWTWLLAQRLGQNPTGFAAAPVAATIALTPASLTLCAGQSQQIQASALTAAGVAVVPQPTFAWSCSSGGSITSAGLFTATAGSGTVVVTASATVAGATISQTASIQLATPSVVITPGALSLTASQSHGFSAVLTDQNGTALPVQPSFAWSSSAGGTITSTGMFTATQTSGSATVQAAATIASVPCAGSSTVALAAPLFVISPSTIAIPTKGSQQFIATVETSSGVPLVPQPALTWTLKGSGGTLSSTGLFTESSTATGTLQVVATAHLASRAYIVEATVQLATPPSVASSDTTSSPPGTVATTTTGGSPAAGDSGSPAAGDSGSPAAPEGAAGSAGGGGGCGLGSAAGVLLGLLLVTQRRRR
jgi:hypothetical protein